MFLRVVTEACRDELLINGLLGSADESSGIVGGGTGGGGISTALRQKDLDRLYPNELVGAGTKRLIKQCLLCPASRRTYSYSHTNKGGPRSSSAGVEDRPLSTGLLLIGRIAWLLKIRGAFLEDALVIRTPSPTTTTTAATATGSNQTGTSEDEGGLSGDTLGTAFSEFDLNSEDQFRSAFEIADTDGDGVVSYSEALEVCFAHIL